MNERAQALETRGLGVPVAVYPLFAAQVFGLVFMQKLGLPLGTKVLQIPLPIMLGALAVRYLRFRQIEVEPLRLVFYMMFCVSATLSQALSKHAFELPAMFLLFLLYFAMTVRIEVDRKTYLRCMNLYQMAMLAVVGIVILQQVMQKLWGFQSWPNMNKMVPEALLVPTFNYYRETNFNSGQFQPNAFFFLEPSFVSQYLALAVVIELVFFERLLWVGLLTAGLFLTLAGTGLLVLAVAAPFLLARTSPKILMVCIVLGVLVGAVGGSLGWFDQFAGRLAEINQPGTSGYYRFTVPYENFMNSMRDVDSALFGQGAGNKVEYEGVVVLDLAIVKLMQEYGLITTISFMAFFCYALFEKAPNGIVAWALFFCFHFCGAALALPVYVIFLITLGTLLRIKPNAAPTAGLPIAPAKTGSLAIVARESYDRPFRTRSDSR